MLIINTLGGLSISLNGEILKDFGSHKAQALLVYLTIEERPIQREVLAGFFGRKTPKLKLWSASGLNYPYCEKT